MDGSRLRELRITSGVSVEDAAKALGITRWTVMVWEKQVALRRPAARRYLSALASVLRQRADTLSGIEALLDALKEEGSKAA